MTKGECPALYVVHHSMTEPISKGVLEECMHYKCVGVTRDTQGMVIHDPVTYFLAPQDASAKNKESRPVGKL